MDAQMTKFEEMRRKMQGQESTAEAQPVANSSLSKFEELKRKMQTQSAPAQEPTPVRQVEPAPIQEPTPQAAPAPEAVPTRSKFEELKRRMQAASTQQAAPAQQAVSTQQTASAQQVAPAQQTAPTQQAEPAVKAFAEFTPEELQNRILLVDVIIADDKDRADVRLHRPPEGYPPLSVEELRDFLVKRGVTNGIDEALLLRLATQPQYDAVLVAARGMDPIHGENGSLTCRFETEQKLLPVERPDGTMDYRNLNYIINVEENEILGDITLPTKGQAGFDVMGRIRPARDGTPVPHPVGRNTALSEDGLQLIATCAGAAEYQAGKVSVTTQVDIPHVDSSTGNIEFRGGSVVVAGDVKEGFSVTAGGDITVKGGVEGAKLTAGGSITLHGMNGLGSGAICAGTDVNASFLENININAQGNVCADVILNCRIECKGDVLLKGANGSLVGGVCTTFGSVKAKEIGNDLDVVTKIELIGPRTLAKEREELDGKIAANAEEMQKLFKVAEAGARPRALITEKRSAEKALADLQMLKDQTDGYQARFDELQAQIEGMGELGVVMAWGTMYPNVRMNLDTIKFNNAYQRPSCCAYYDQGEIGFRSGQKF